MFCQNNLVLDFSVVFQWRSLFGYLSWRIRRKNKKKNRMQNDLSVIQQYTWLLFHLKTPYSAFYSFKWRRPHMVISAWIFIKPIFIIPPWQMNSMYSSIYLSCLFLRLPHLECWYMYRTKLTRYNLKKLWERRRERTKKAQRCHESNYMRRSLFLGNTC